MYHVYNSRPDCSEGGNTTLSTGWMFIHWSVIYLVDSATDVSILWKTKTWTLISFFGFWCPKIMINILLEKLWLCVFRVKEIEGPSCHLVQFWPSLCHATIGRAGVQGKLSAHSAAKPISADQNTGCDKGRAGTGLGCHSDKLESMCASLYGFLNSLTLTVNFDSV